MIGIIGAGGHAKVVKDILEEVYSLHDFTFFSTSPIHTSFDKYNLYPDSLTNILKWSQTIATWHVAIGNPKIRKEKVELLQLHNLSLATAIHPSSVISKNSTIGKATSIMAGSVINSDAQIGENCIINTSSSIDHDCRIENHVNIGPGSHLAGNVTVGELSDLGAGTIVIPNIKIGKRCTIGAGAVVITDIPDDSVAVGVPAKIISSKG
ncbi:acetyltransferase [Metabacillus rhizolycopersici]|uniref:Acetyltransferase n=1 Tax=Metabacillus rhizolycopersici TaxID=2875709 RepID=A0ABS7UVB7_9BACI|nr:acetyltransferase [Metabacillus rhizolycopersici]MBZ5751967.1 acetyltransferase [Metabacillus rhizolycopersici]